MREIVIHEYLPLIRPLAGFPPTKFRLEPQPPGVAPGRAGKRVGSRAGFFTRSVNGRRARGTGAGGFRTESPADEVSPRAHAEGRRGPRFLTGRAEPAAASDNLEVVGMGLGTLVPELADEHVTCAVTQGPVLGGSWF